MNKDETQACEQSAAMLLLTISRYFHLLSQYDFESASMMINNSINALSILTHYLDLDGNNIEKFHNELFTHKGINDNG